jgi:uncharacterized protein YegP (UPF0339 family)
VPGKFELYKDIRERYRFRLVSESGELILSGDGYTQKVLALDAIVSIMRSASEAAVIDLSQPENREIPIEDDALTREEEISEAYGEELDFPKRRKKKRKKGSKAGKGKKPGNRGKSGHRRKKGKRKKR